MSQRVRRVWLVQMVLGTILFTSTPSLAQPLAQPLAPSLNPEQFRTDIQVLTRNPHRLAGSSSGREAGDYILQRLEAIGVEAVFPIDMVVWQTEVDNASLTLGDQTFTLQPLRANVTVPPVTGRQGVTGPIIYVGDGRLSSYGSRDAQDAIVVMDYHTQDRWEQAFALGAKAVVFLGNGAETDATPKFAGVPTRQLRFFVPHDAPGIEVLRRDHQLARLDARITWQQRIGRNIIARIPGSDPDFSPGRKGPEAIVIAVNYDSFGMMPHLSPAARGAANVAAVLQMVQAYHARPLKRDVIVMFLDNESRYHQGSRQTYQALMLSQREFETIVEEHANELAWNQVLIRLLEHNGFRFQNQPIDIPRQASGTLDDYRDNLNELLKHEADFVRTDILTREQPLNMARYHLERSMQQTPPGEPVPDELQQRHEALTSQLKALKTRRDTWDDIRRELYKNRISGFVVGLEASASGDPEAEVRLTLYRPVLDELKQRVLQRLNARRGELQTQVRIDQQQTAMRQALFDRDANDGLTAPWICLHIDMNLSGATQRWSAVAGEWTSQLFKARKPSTDADQPGLYSGVMRVFRQAKEQAGAWPMLDTAPLLDPMTGYRFASGPFVSSGYVPGGYGIYNLSYMTGYEARPHDGQPSDTVDRLILDRFLAQVDEATRLTRTVGQDPGLSLDRVFNNLSQSNRATWSNGRWQGPSAQMRVSGDLSENRPASQAMLAVWPGQLGWIQTQAWTSLQDALVLPGFDPMTLVSVNADGRFSLNGMRRDLDQTPMMIGTTFDEQGFVNAITTQETTIQSINSAIRVDLFPGHGFEMVDIRTYPTKPEMLNVLRAANNSPFRSNRSLWGQLNNQTFFYIADQIFDDRVKIFQPMGPVAIHITQDDPYGEGYSAEMFYSPPPISPITAGDLWQLNETRLDRLRERGVTSADIELLHARALREQRTADDQSKIANRQALYKQSASLSNRVYSPLRKSMDDLVYAVVVLLLLAIPFAFAMERLVICATSIYGRIAGFFVMFMATFLLLYFMHPGFAIGQNPIIIFLAFAIILLSSLVIYIITRKFQTELKQIQGQKSGAHAIEVSQTATMLAAVNVGISTMRRRPTRTILTAVTVVMLTFTILCFASFSRQIGVRSTYVGPVSENAGPALLIRNLDFSRMEHGLIPMLATAAGEDGFLAGHWWLVPQPIGDMMLAYSITNQSAARSVKVSGIMGVDPQEVERWPDLAAAIRRDAMPSQTAADLRDDGVYLPLIIKEQLDVEVGDTVLVAGRPRTLAGVFDQSALQRLKHLDGQSVIPVNFEDEQNMQGTNAGSNEDDVLLADDVQKDFAHLNANQVVITSDAFVRDAGGGLHVITMYPGRQVDVLEAGQRLAEVVIMPVWAAGPDGVERMLLTVLTEVSGGLALGVPLILGGLIIFGTLLGSINDREKEIYTFSALGLSPVHVGVLFFAEAAVYAALGGMGGQLLAQVVAMVASILAEQGLIQPASINYSSTNSLFAIGVVMATVIVSAIYPAMRASRSANPGVARTWQLPQPQGDVLTMVFPFTVSAYDITGVVSFLAEHFRQHDDAGLGNFAASHVRLGRSDPGNLKLESDLALAPFDLGVTEHLVLTAVPSQIPGVDEVEITVRRLSGAGGDWYRANKVFVRDLRRQFLLWRTLSAEMIETYRMSTLQTLGELEQTESVKSNTE